MRINKRILGAAAFTGLMLFAHACGGRRNAALPPPPPPPPSPTQANENAPAQNRPESLIPRIGTFIAEPRQIERGQSALLRWSVENATDVSIETSLGAVRAGGSQEVFPTGTSTYTLIAKNAAGMDSRSVTVEVVTPLPASARGASSATTMSGADFFAGGGLDVYFDYDRTEIRNDGRLVLTRDASILKGIFAQDPRFALVLEGHCDERGSAEYNLGLGDRRAIAAKDLLVQLGLAAERVRTISYGKDRPVCTDVNEACYQRNRRVHLFPAQ